MRLTFNEYLNNNKDYLEDKIRFIHNDLWHFSSEKLDFTIDLLTAENSVWGVSKGIYNQGLYPVVYGVSFFNIGRLEQLRKFFGSDQGSNSNRKSEQAKCCIINAGHKGYERYGYEHSMSMTDDITLMEELGFYVYEIIDEVDYQEFLNDFQNMLDIKQFRNIYVILHKDF